MNTQEKRPSGWCNIQNGPAVEKCDAAQFHRLQFTTPNGGNSMVRIEDYLKHGQENATSANALCGMINTTPRGLRHCIAIERAAGAEILYTPGGRGGYFLPSLDKEQAQKEREAFYNVMRARAMCTLKALQPVARSLGVPIGQMEMELLNDGEKEES